MLCVNGDTLTSVCPVDDKIMASWKLLNWRYLLSRFRFTVIAILHVVFEYYDPRRKYILCYYQCEQVPMIFIWNPAL